MEEVVRRGSVVATNFTTLIHLKPFDLGDLNLLWSFTGVPEICTAIYLYLDYACNF